jgi:multicomponent K+:H+ antiporter subunit D
MWMENRDMVNHLIIAPIVLPLLAGALLVLLEKAQSRWVPTLALASTMALLWVAVLLLLQAQAGSVQVYLLGNWQAPWGIALALDRLSALMLLLTAVVALASLVYALGGDDRKGLHFHALLQFQLMGLNGAFLTADLFNLFVFFEVLLAASYGLLLHGASLERLKASVHYVAFNLAGSTLFLVAVSLLYALTGTLNMADLAVKLPQLGAENARLAQAAVLLLVVVFGVKAALLPLYFWLPATYAAATASVAALFAIMTKVGVYAIVRVSTLWTSHSDGHGAAGLAGLLTPALPLLALATLVLAAIGALAARRLRALVAYLVVASAGTLLLAIGLGTEQTLAAGLFYLVNSTLMACLWFLLADRIALARGGDDALSPRQLQQGWAVLGALFFVASVAIAGIPPLAGFLGKALLLQAAGRTPLAGWVVSTVLASSLLIMVALARAGAQLFWTPGARAIVPVEQPARVHKAAIASLLALVLAATVFAGPLQAYAQVTAQQLTQRQPYINAVLGAQAVSPAFDVRREMRERGELNK